MKNLWSDQEAANFPGLLGQRVYTSRLLGRDPDLVLHGGGNTSVKIQEKNVFGEQEDILYVKGSGWDLETIEAAGFAPVRLQPMLKLAELPGLSDLDMVNALRTSMTRASAPSPSVETILHAILPYRYVDHTHADSLIAITNTPQGLERIQQIYQDRVVIIPYIMPGFDLARLVQERFAGQVTKNTIGMVLMNHGMFSFGETAQESYNRMIELVSLAEDYLQKKNAWALPEEKASLEDTTLLRNELAELRTGLSRVAGHPVILKTDQQALFLDFARHPEVARLSQQGPVTPDHVIRTKRFPLLGRDIGAYVQDYQSYFDTCAKKSSRELTMLNPVPRMLLDPQFGFGAVGDSAKDTKIITDIYRHSIEVILRATALGGYQALPEQDIFDMEYWELEQAKLRKSGTRPLFAGEVVLITGAASGIGRACVDAFLRRGAAVIAVDINRSVESMLPEQPAYLGLCADVTDTAAIRRALELGVRQFGGLDMLVLNAGIFPPGCELAELGLEDWHKVMRVNLDANFILMHEAYPLLKLAPRYGRVAIIGSRNVTAPGPGAAAYSASKAALNQLARVAAMEWAGDGIRINSLHPDAVFDTGIWSESVLQARAAHYQMTVEQYKKRNLLKTEITSREVAELTAELCGPLFAGTTGAQLPIDGGNDRVI